MNEVEAVARALAPSRWEVMDHYLAQTKRKYDGENAAYDPDQFKDRESMVTAQAAIAALDAARGDQVARFVAHMKTLQPDEDVAECPATWGDFLQILEAEAEAWEPFRD